RSAYRPADRPMATDAVGIRLGERNGLCETSSWRLLLRGIRLGLSHHSWYHEQRGAAASIFNSYRDIPANPDTTVTTAGGTRLAYNPRDIADRFAEAKEASTEDPFTLEFVGLDADRLTLR